jgi:alpha-glucosidase (family GH31 glycosyl hydrolase)
MQADCLLLESQLISSRSMTTAEQNTNVLIRGERKAFDSLVQRYTYLKKDVSYETDNALWYKFSNGFNVYSHDTSRTEAIEGWKSLYKQMLNECERSIKMQS